MHWIAPCLCICLHFPDPLHTDLPRFPCSTAQRTWESYRAQLAVLDEQLEIGGCDRDMLQAVRDEMYFCERCWNYLDDATRMTAGDHWRRQALETLRFLLGERAYQDGIMPPVAPYVWRE